MIGKNEKDDTNLSMIKEEWTAIKKEKDSLEKEYAALEHRRQILSMRRNDFMKKYDFNSSDLKTLDSL